MKRTSLFAILTIMLIATAGCQPKTPGDIILTPTGLTPRADYALLEKAMDKLLNKRGDLVIEKIDVGLPILTEQLNLLAVTGPTVSPELFKTTEEKLAYWYNARMAWSLRLASQPGSDAPLNCRFSLDGRTMTLAEMDREIFALGGRMALIGAPGMDLRRAPFPKDKKPFSAKTIDAAFQSQFEAFIDDRNRLVQNVMQLQMEYPPVIWRFRDAFKEEYVQKFGGPGAEEITLTTALLPRVTGQALRRLQNGVGYACVEGVKPHGLARTGEFPDKKSILGLE